MATFNTDQPQRLIYSNGIFNIEALGGIRLEGLDRMRVTVKVSLCESEVPPLRHNLDLYNDSQLEKMVRKIAERLEIGTSTTAHALAELTQYLENYRLDRIREQGIETTIVPGLTEQQREDAIQYLKEGNLLQKTIHDLYQSGIQGEKENALILYLAMSSKRMEEPISVFCLAASGMGKSYLMERVAMCIPDEDKKEHTQFTSNALYYYKRDEIRNKVFLIEDLEGAVNALFPIRELQSKKRISRTITRKGKDGRLETVTLVVEGPVSVIGVTTEESIYEDNANRSILIYLDDSKEQDNRIMDYHKRKRAGLIDTYQEQLIQKKLQNIQRALEPIRVINPYAPMIDLPEHFPKKRRALPILLNFIEAITFYHQYQREQKVDTNTGEMYIECTPEDVVNGFNYLKSVLIRRSDELNGAVRGFYERLVSILSVLKQNKFKVTDIRKHMYIAPRTVYHYLKILTEYGYVEIIGGKQRIGFEYLLQDTFLQSKITSELDSHLETIIQKMNAVKRPSKRKKQN
jgi:DNA primase